MAINPLAYTENIVRNFLRYQLTSYGFADERLNEQLRSLLSLDETRATPLGRGPYVSLSRAFKGGATIERMVEDRVFHPHLRQLIPFPALYGHQEEAIRAIAAGRTTLISTGTGSGKSECFLYPIISRCLELKDDGAEAGIAAVLVYPMNALAEDQLGRLRGLLAGTGIPFGMYVGKTPEREADVAGLQLPPGSSAKDYEAALARERDAGTGTTVHPAEELSSREAMRTAGQQPRILLTNVNQLELLLTRHRDVELFDGARLDFLVFDEAHTFTGAQGAESACLVRRLRSFCGRGEDETCCVATSATIVDEGDPEAARAFASRFFGVKREAVAAVHESYEPDVWGDARVVPPAPDDPSAGLDLVRGAVDAEDAEAAVRSAWKELSGQELGTDDWEEALHRELSRNELLYQASQALAEPRPLAELASEVGESVGREVTEEELILWLTLGAAARLEDRPLVRPVCHAFVRGIPGAVVTFGEGDDEPVLHLSAEGELDPEDGELHLRVFACTTCGQHYFEHALSDFEFTGAIPGGGDAEGERRFWQVLDPVHGGVRVLLLDRLISESDDEDDSGSKKLSPIFLCRGCGTAHGDDASPCLGCGSGERLLTLQAVQQKEKRPGLLTSCVCCGAIGKESAGPFREPAKPVRGVNVADVHVLAQEMIQHAERRRLLVFADNRQDAAFQAGWMRDHARRYRLRSMIADVLRREPHSVGDLMYALDRQADEDDGLSRTLLPEVWNHYPKESGGKEHQDRRRYLLRILILREISTGLKQQIGLEPWGRLKVEYLGLEESGDFVQRWSSRLSLPAHELAVGVAAFLDMLRRKTLLYDRSGKIFSRYWREGDQEVMEGFLPLLPGVPQGLKLTRAPSDDSGRVTHWVSPTGHLTLATEVARKFGAEEAAGEFLEELWEHLTSKEVGLLVPVTLTGSRGNALPRCAGTHQIDGDKLRLARNHGVYRCRTCRRRTLRPAPGRKCLAWHCKGNLEYVEEAPDNYDLTVLDGDYSLLRPREHTAMVPTAERERIEELFKSDGETINTLVCTQTLELGVDIGALDAVLMRNVPPLPANYWQRAGRAGRRHRMAVNVTYSRPVSHDRAYFAEPLKMLGGRVDPPSFNLANELMVGKHVRATVLTRLQHLARPESGLSESDREEVAEALGRAFPGRITEYLFEEAGRVRTAPRDVRSLHTVITKHQKPIEATVLAAFEQGWPEDDRQVVSPEALGTYVLGMTDELEAVLKRLFRRLHWALDQMERLEVIRRRDGVLNPEDDSFFFRCKRLVQRYKGFSKRKREQAEGVDDIVTFSVLAQEGFLPGYGLESGAILGRAQVRKSVRGGRDFDLPRAPAVALREYVPGNLIYANGQKFVARRYMFDAEHREGVEQLEVIPDREAVRLAEGSPGGFSSLVVTSVPIADVSLVHIDRISDEEENRFQMAVGIYGRELDQHDGGTAYLWGDRAMQHRKGVRLQLVNVGSRSGLQSAEKKVGYPVCRNCGDSVSPFSSQRQQEDFDEKHQDWCGRKPESVAFHTNLAVDTLTLPECEDHREAYSIAEALRFAAASVLDMDTDDLHVLVVGHPDTEALDAYLYDPMPGGSGLLDQICERFAEIVAEAERMARDCPAACADSCIDCFQIYRNAFYHEHLDRHLVIERIGTWGNKLEISHAIPPLRDTAPSAGDDAVGSAEKKLRAMLKAAGFPEGRWQSPFPLPKPFGSTTPDVTYDQPDDPDEMIFIYLDGLSSHIHGNPETRAKDLAIRAELRTSGHNVLEITAHDLDNVQAMTRAFRKLGRLLIGRDQADRVQEHASEWFGARNEEETESNS